MSNRELAEGLKNIKVNRLEIVLALSDAGGYFTDDEKKLIDILTSNLPTIIEALEK